MSGNSSLYLPLSSQNCGLLKHVFTSHTSPPAPATKEEAAKEETPEKISPLVKLTKESTLRVDAVYDAQVPRRP